MRRPLSAPGQVLAVLFALANVGCFTARIATGPHLDTEGRNGVTVTGGVGMGWSFKGHQAVYAVLNGGVVGDEHAHGQLFDAISYVNYGLPLPVRVDARIGLRFGRERFAERDRSMFGAAIAVLPWHVVRKKRFSDSGKGWDPTPDLAAVRGLGVEVAIDALPAPSAAERGFTAVTVSLVGDLGSMFAR